MPLETEILSSLETTSEHHSTGAIDGAQRKEMAEIVSLVVDKLIPLIGVHGEVKSIKDELESIASFLVEADVREARGESNENVRIWVRQVRELAYRIEDVIDKYTHLVARRCHEQGVSKFLRKTGRFIRKLAVHHEIASQIEGIKKDVLEIKSRADRYGLMVSTQQQVTNSSPIASLFILEAEVVGMEGPFDLLASWLNEEVKGERMVISVVGMGGLGKTTLTRKLYDSLISQFDCYAWITVSQAFSTQDLLKSIIRQFYRAQKASPPMSVETMDGIELLIMELRDYVRGKRYLVVFDDVWSRELCENMTYVLPENYTSSRILFTTRSEDVAPSSAHSSLNRVYKLPLLSFEKSFELFCKKVFRAYNGGMCPPGLMELSIDIVTKCDGLPLAIVSVGGSLSIKEKNVVEWKKFHNTLHSKLGSDEQLARVNKILSLSYHDLSPNLKSCLLYFGIYMQDCSIRCSRLIRQWIAEGLVKAKNNEVLEDVGEECLAELIHRSVIQVSKRDWSGKVRECRVHDLMREVILLKSDDIRFCRVAGENVDGRARRLPMNNAVNTSCNDSYTRSLFVFQTSSLPRDFMKNLIGNMKMLKMLDLEGTKVSLLPESLGDLYHLSYLSVRATRIEKLPESIGKLIHLETLDMKDTRVCELPVEIKRLHKLRHLLGYGYTEASTQYDLTYFRGFKVQESLGCSETLQKLSHVEADSGTIVEDLIHFSKLRKLGITKVRSRDVTQMFKGIEKMKELQSLEIIAIDEEQVLDLESMHSPPPLLQRLWLKGPLLKIPSWVIRLQNVVKMCLCWSGLETNFFPALQDLPNLCDLCIGDDAYKGEHLHFGRGGFGKLKSLSLVRLKVLRGLVIEEGAFPCLEEMNIGYVSPKMEEVPSSIHHLSNLKNMKFFDFTEALCMKMVPGGPSYSIIQHIPNVEFCFGSGVLSHYSFTPARYQQLYGPREGIC